MVLRPRAREARAWSSAINTTQDNIRKPQTALKLPGIFEILHTAWFCMTAISQLKIKISAKPHQRKPLRLPKNQRMAVPG